MTARPQAPDATGPLQPATTIAVVGPCTLGGAGRGRTGVRGTAFRSGNAPTVSGLRPATTEFHARTLFPAYQDVVVFIGTCRNGGSR